MCNLYKIQVSTKELAESLSSDYDEDEIVWRNPIAPNKAAPVLVQSKTGQRLLKSANFGLKSADKRFANLTLTNARVESLFSCSKPWAKEIQNKRCLVPMTHFEEPCYWGKEEGNAIELATKNNDLLGVAGVFSLAGDQLSMALIMRPAGEQMDSLGHHREPFFINSAFWDEWIARGAMDKQAIEDSLRESFFKPIYSYKVLRALKKGSQYEKRREANQNKRIEQLEKSKC